MDALEKSSTRLWCRQKPAHTRMGLTAARIDHRALGAFGVGIFGYVPPLRHLEKRVYNRSTAGVHSRSVRSGGLCCFKPAENAPFLSIGSWCLLDEKIPYTGRTIKNNGCVTMQRPPIKVYRGCSQNRTETLCANARFANPHACPFVLISKNKRLLQQPSAQPTRSLRHNLSDSFWGIKSVAGCGTYRAVEVRRDEC